MTSSVTVTTQQQVNWQRNSVHACVCFSFVEKETEEEQRYLSSCVCVCVSITHYIYTALSQISAFSFWPIAAQGNRFIVLCVFMWLYVHACGSPGLRFSVISVYTSFTLRDSRRTLELAPILSLRLLCFIWYGGIVSKWLSISVYRQFSHRAFHQPTAWGLAELILSSGRAANISCTILCTPVSDAVRHSCNHRGYAKMSKISSHLWVNFTWEAPLLLLCICLHADHVYSTFTWLLCCFCMH